MAGTLIISLDFELYWGVRDHASLASYQDKLLGVRQAVPAMLDAFARHRVHATWATVGFLFFETKSALLAGLPKQVPAYEEAALSPYGALASLGEDETVDPFHFGASLINSIRATPGQELGTHTFSHYYALERGQTRQTFHADLQAAVRAAHAQGVTLRSLVFPRNQVNAEYLAACHEQGITSYRGNERSWIYRERRGTEERWWKRGSRLADAYANISGHHTYRLASVAQAGPPFNLPSSRFLRPWSRRLRALEERRLRRIEDGMTHAARSAEAFHLWWHPHNFGTNLAQNMANLERLLTHFDSLRHSFGFQSRNMGEVASSLAGAEARPGGRP